MTPVAATTSDVAPKVVLPAPFNPGAYGDPWRAARTATPSRPDRRSARSASWGHGPSHPSDPVQPPALAFEELPDLFPERPPGISLGLGEIL